MEQTSNKRLPRRETAAVFVIPILISVGFICFYLINQMSGIYAGDSGDLVAAAYTWGIAHPPGYPLYTFLSGLLAHFLPIGTIAWRVGLMSSIPMGCSLYFLWKTARYLTKNNVWSSVGVIVYGFMAPIWLHAIDQEVFGLFSLFSAMLLYLFCLWFEQKKPWQLFTLAFISGLSLTHHHLIVFTLVAGVVFIYQHKGVYFSQIKKTFLPCTMLFMLGLLPYVYMPIASLHNPAVTPGNALTMQGFLTIVTRASYGTFRAAANVSSSLLDRVLNVFTFIQFSARDFTIIGLIGVVIGVLSLRKKNTPIYFFLIVIGFLWIFYYFYAGFPLLINYQIGTVERFVIVPYQILLLFFTVGCVEIDRFMRNLFIGKIVLRVIMPIFFTCIVCGWFIYTIFQYAPAIWYLRNDRSMEVLGANLDASVPTNAIVLLFEDTSSYAFYHYYYVLGKRSDIVFIKMNRLFDAEYRNSIKRQYPELIIPPYDNEKALGNYIATFFSQNISKNQIVSDDPFAGISGVWVPYGLVFIYAPSQAYVAPLPLVMKNNESIWTTFPANVQLMRFKNNLLLLSDILRIYAQRRLALALYVVKQNGDPMIVTQLFSKALQEEMNVVPEQYIQVVLTLLDQKNCSYGKTLLDLMYKKWGSDYTILTAYHRVAEACTQLITDPEVQLRDREYRSMERTNSVLPK